MSVLTLEAKLERLDSATPWGFRMQGGKDFHSPLTIQRVSIPFRICRLFYELKKKINSHSGLNRETIFSTWFPIVEVSLKRKIVKKTCK